MRQVTTLIASTIVLALAGAAFAELGGSVGEHSRQALPLVNGPRKSGLKISGHVKGLYPGASSQLTVKVKNRFPFALRVRSIWAVAGDGARFCSGENLRVRGRRRPLRIPAHRSRRVDLGIALASTASSFCQGARFPLRFGARASR
jgi:hypothetical protein